MTRDGRSALEADEPDFRPVPCPNCAEPLKLVPILYGYPAPEAWEQVRRGEISLGGCIVSDDDPEFVCAACEQPIRIESLGKSDARA